jgi:hypothetical protein
MEIKVLSDKILLGERSDVIRLYIYAKLMEYGIKPYEHDVNIILELYIIGGYSNKKEQSKFIQTCLEKRFKRTEQSVRNTLSKYTSLKVLHKPRSLALILSEDFLPEIICDKLVLQPLISHIN